MLEKKLATYDNWSLKKQITYASADMAGDWNAKISSKVRADKDNRVSR